LNLNKPLEITPSLRDFLHPHRGARHDTPDDLSPPRR
jgi:hypothetical protein